MNDIRYPERLTISWICEQYRSGALTPDKLIQHCMEKIRQDRSYNIWIHVLEEEEIYPYLDRLSTKDRDLPLWGIPFAIKDNIDLEGVPTTAACPTYSYTPDESATVVQKLIDMGAVPLGKTNLDQFATGLVGTRSPYGAVHNALDEELISGGSSSGSAVSVALGEAAFSLGTDTAGSGRVPAALNRLVGLKTSIGAWSTKGVIPACASLDCVTVFASSTEDCYLVDQCVRGEDPKCSYSRALPVLKPSSPACILLPDEEPVFYGPYEGQYRESWNLTCRCIESMNIPVRRIDTAFLSDAAKLLYDGPCVAERWADLGEFVSHHPSEVFPVTRKILESGNRPDQSASDVYRALHTLQRYKHEAWNLLKGNILILPTCGGTYKITEVQEDPVATNSNMGLYTNHCNLLDLAAIAVPSETASKLPFGITAFSRSDEEGLLKGFAYIFGEGKNL